MWSLFANIDYKIDFLKVLSNIIFPLYTLCYVGFGSHVGLSRDVSRSLICGTSNHKSENGKEEFLLRYHNILVDMPVKACLPS